MFYKGFDGFQVVLGEWPVAQWPLVFGSQEMYSEKTHLGNREAKGHPHTQEVLRKGEWPVAQWPLVSGSQEMYSEKAHRSTRNQHPEKMYSKKHMARGQRPEATRVKYKKGNQEILVFLMF